MFIIQFKIIDYCVLNNFTYVNGVLTYVYRISDERFYNDFKEIIKVHYGQICEAMNNKTWQNSLICQQYGITDKVCFNRRFVVSMIEKDGGVLYLRGVNHNFSSAIKFDVLLTASISLNWDFGLLPTFESIYKPELGVVIDPLPTVQKSLFSLSHSIDINIHNSVKQGIIQEMEVTPTGEVNYLQKIAIVGGGLSVLGAMSSNEQKMHRATASVFAQGNGISNPYTEFLQDMEKIKVSVNKESVKKISEMGKVKTGIWKPASSWIVGQGNRVLLSAMGFVNQFGVWVLPYMAAESVYQYASRTREEKINDAILKAKTDSAAKKFFHFTEVDTDAYDQATQKYWEEKLRESTEEGKTADGDDVTDQKTKQDIENEQKEAEKANNSTVDYTEKMNALNSLISGLSTVLVGGIAQIVDTLADTKGAIDVQASKLDMLSNLDNMQLKLDKLDAINGINTTLLDNADKIGKVDFVEGSKVGLDTTGANVGIDTSNLENASIETNVNVTLDTTGAKVELAEGAKVAIDETSLTGINAISETMIAHEAVRQGQELERLERERLKEERDIAAHDIDYKNEDAVQKNAKVINQLKKEAMVQPVEGLSYPERIALEHTANYSQTTYTTAEGVELKKGLKANAGLSHQEAYNNTMLSEGEIRGKEKFVNEFLPKILAMIPETTEGTLKRFADINPEVRSDFHSFIQTIFMKSGD